MKTSRVLQSFQPRFPRHVTPYRTRLGALESLDNGGRSWNLTGPVRFAVLTESVPVEGRSAPRPIVWAWSHREG